MKHPDLFTYRDLPGGLGAPSGPATTIPTREDGKRMKYLDWRLTEGGAKAWAQIVRWAREEYYDGVKRVSINRLVERVRLDRLIKINNSWRSYLSDDLVALHPELDAVIERRKRTKEQRTR